MSISDPVVALVVSGGLWLAYLHGLARLLGERLNRNQPAPEVKRKRRLPP